MSLVREIQVKFRMTPQERELLEEKMTLAGTGSKGHSFKAYQLDHNATVILIELRRHFSMLRNRLK